MDENDVISIEKLNYLITRVRILFNLHQTKLRITTKFNITIGEIIQ